METLSNASGTFAIRLLKILCQDSPTRNVFCSPVSISSALAMVLLGAKGNTATQMAQVSLPVSQEQGLAWAACSVTSITLILHSHWERRAGLGPEYALAISGRRGSTGEEGGRAGRQELCSTEIYLGGNFPPLIPWKRPSKLSCPGTESLFRKWYWNYLKHKLQRPTSFLPQETVTINFHW